MAFGGSIKLQGETEYKKALQNIKTGLKEVSGEMKLMTAQYQSNDRNVASLSAKSGELAKKLETQKKALDGLKQTYAQMAQQYEANAKKNAELAQKYESEKSKLETIGRTLGTTSKEYQEQAKVVDALEKELNDSNKAQEATEKSMSAMKMQIITTETSIVKAENSLNSLNQQLEEAEKDADGAGDSIGELGKDASDASGDLGDMGEEAGRAGEDVAGAGDEAEDAGAKFEAFATIAVDSLKAIALATTAVIAGATAVGKSIADLANETGKYGDEIDKESQKLQLSAETYQKLDYALQRNGSDIGQVSKAIKTITGDLADFQNGVEGASDKYEALGISLTNTDGSMKKTEEVLIDSLNALANMTDETQRNAMAQDLFGRSYAEMLPLLNAGGDSLKELMQEAEDYGMVMSDEAVKASAEYSDSLLKLKGTFTGVKNSIGAEFLPAITQIMDGMSDLMKGNEGATDAIKEGAQTIITKIKDMIPQITDFAQTLGRTFLSIAPDMLKSLAEGLLSGLPLLLPVVKEVIDKLLKTFTTLAPQVITVGIQLISQIISGIGTMLPSAVDSITKLIPLLVKSLTSGLPLIIKSATTLFGGILKAIPIIAQNIIPNLSDMIVQICDALTESVDILAEAGSELFDVLVTDVLPQLYNTLNKEAPKIITTVVNSLMKSIGKMQTAGGKMFASITQSLMQFIPILVKQMPLMLEAITTELTKPETVTMLTESALEMFMAIGQANAEFVRIFMPEIPKFVLGIGEALLAQANYLAKTSLKLFLNILSALKEVGSKIIEEAKKIVSNLGTNLVTPLQTKFSDMKNNLKNTFSGFAEWFKGVFSDAWGRVQGVFSNWGSFFSGLWGKIKSTFSSLGTSIASAISGSVKSGINGVISMIQNTINAGIRNINGAINLINKLPNVNVSKIDTLSLPRLAKGAILTKPTIAEIAENGKEAVLPLENNTEWIRGLASDISSMMLKPIQTMTETKSQINSLSYGEMVDAFKEALDGMEVVMDGEQMGTFINKTVARAIYT